MQVTRLQALPAELPPGLLEAVHTPEHVAALRETSARVQGPTAVRDPDDPGQLARVSLAWFIGMVSWHGAGCFRPPTAVGSLTGSIPA